ncbi:MAG: NHLP bacteriocin system secretion protein [Bacteroidota bacterium]
MPPGFFRKAALEKLSTPEKLDQLIKITSPRAWLALVTIALILTTAITWGFWGRVKTKLTASGVLLGGEVYDVVATAQGQLVELKVASGDVVNEGDVIAEIQQPEIFQAIEEAKASLTERNYELQQLTAFGSQDTRLQGELIQQQRLSIQQQIESNQKNLSFLQQQLEIEKELLEKGLITRPQVVSSEQQIEGTQNQIESLKAQLVQISSQELNVDFDLKQRTTIVKQRIAQEERRLEQLKERYDIQTNIKSPHSGQVVEVLTNDGIVVGLGTPLFKLKNDAVVDGKIRGILYVPSKDGKKIKVGMEALVVPATVQPQEHGYMKAKVTYVSEFPVTQQGMMTMMKNDQLVRGLLAMGAPFEVYVDFEKDANSFSGFCWTSAKGPEVTVNAGTSCMGKITVKEDPPITMVVPALKKFFDLY